MTYHDLSLKSVACLFNYKLHEHATGIDDMIMDNVEDALDVWKRTTWVQNMIKFYWTRCEYTNCIFKIKSANIVHLEDSSLTLCQWVSSLYRWHCIPTSSSRLWRQKENRSLKRSIRFRHSGMRSWGSRPGCTPMICQLLGSTDLYLVSLVSPATVCLLRFNSSEKRLFPADFLLSSSPFTPHEILLSFFSSSSNDLDLSSSSSGFPPFVVCTRVFVRVRWQRGQSMQKDRNMQQMACRNKRERHTLISMQILHNVTFRFIPKRVSWLDVDGWL